MEIFTAYGSPESVLAETNSFLAQNPALTINFFQVKPIVYNERNLSLALLIGYSNGTISYQLKFFYGSITETLAKVKYFLSTGIIVHFIDFFPFLFHKKDLFLFIAILYHST